MQAKNSYIFETFLNEIRFRIHWNFPNEKWRPKIPISQTFLNEIRFSIKLTLTSRSKIPISSQTLLNEIRFRIKLKVSE